MRPVQYVYYITPTVSKNDTHIKKCDIISYMAKEREDKVKALRLLKLEHLIKTLNYPNTTVLCKKLEVSRRTILTKDLGCLKRSKKML